MPDTAPRHGDARIIQPGEAPSYWQPVPANGFVNCILGKHSIESDTAFSMGTQTVAPGCHVREHSHAEQEEIIHFIEGEAVVTLDGEETPVRAGATVFLGVNRKHGFFNPGPGPMTFVWILMPGGLDEFFAAIGRPRAEGEEAPMPFPRPDNVAEIERNTVFGWTDPNSGNGG